MSARGLFGAKRKVAWALSKAAEGLQADVTSEVQECLERLTDAISQFYLLAIGRSAHRGGAPGIGSEDAGVAITAGEQASLGGVAIAGWGGVENAGWGVIGSGGRGGMGSAAWGVVQTQFGTSGDMMGAWGGTWGRDGCVEWREREAGVQIGDQMGTGEERGKERYTGESLSEEAGEERLCVVCMDASRSARFYPCGHRIACIACAEKWRARGGTCPFCDMRIQGVQEE